MSECKVSDVSSRACEKGTRGCDVKHPMKFPIIPASKQSFGGRKPIYGIGVNDADYVVNPKVDGKHVQCHFYGTWHGMLARCYSEKYHIKQPTYVGCSAAPEFHSFMTFKAWMETQEWQGKHLDKDIMLPGNKVYGPDTCVFVDSEINALLTNVDETKGEFPRGVDYHKPSRKYRSKLSKYGRRVHVGLFDTAEEASASYREAKRLHLLAIACCEPDIRVKRGLYLHSETFRNEQ